MRLPTVGSAFETTQVLPDQSMAAHEGVAIIGPASPRVGRRESVGKDSPSLDVFLGAEKLGRGADGTA